MTGRMDRVKAALRDQKKDLRPRDTWRYFCGCCWKEITEMQKAAAAILNEEGLGETQAPPAKVEEAARE